jgi:hypothetical protein
MVASGFQENAMKTGVQECTIASVRWIDIVAISLSVKTKEKKGNAAATEKRAAAVLSEARFVRPEGPRGNPG